MSNRKKSNPKHHTKAIYASIVILVVILIWAIYTYTAPTVTVPTVTQPVPIASTVSPSAFAQSSVAGLSLVISDFNATTSSVCIQTHTAPNQVYAVYAVHIFNRFNATVHYDSAYPSFVITLSNGTKANYQGSLDAKFPIFNKDIVVEVAVPIAGKGFEHAQVVAIRATFTLSVEEVTGPFALSFNLPPPKESSC